MRLVTNKDEINRSTIHRFEKKYLGKNCQHKKEYQKSFRLIANHYCLLINKLISHVEKNAELYINCILMVQIKKRCIVYIKKGFFDITDSLFSGF